MIALTTYKKKQKRFSLKLSLITLPIAQLILPLLLQWGPEMLITWAVSRSGEGDSWGRRDQYLPLVEGSVCKEYLPSVLGQATFQHSQ